MNLRDPARPGPIVVGVERSERSRDALALARTLARAAGSRLILVAVYRREGRDHTSRADHALETLEWVARPLAGVRAELRAVAGTSVARELQRVATEEDALAIVVGPSHRGSVGRVLPGSVGARLLRGAPCPVAVAPRGYWGWAFAPIRRIGVGYVGTPDAGEALSAAVGLATAMGAEIRVLNVVEPVAITATVPMGLGFAEREEFARIDLANSLEQAVERAGGSLEISGEVVDGYADDELARLSAELDVLVCGSRGHGPLGSVMLGSVSEGVLRKARCPVLIVPRGARDGFAALRARTTTDRISQLSSTPQLGRS